ASVTTGMSLRYTGFWKNNSLPQFTMLKTKPFFSCIFFTFISLACFSQSVSTITDPVEWVNPLMGTDSKPSLSNGNTYPSISVPWGMNFWVPQTNVMGDGWQYQYGAEKI